MGEILSYSLPKGWSIFPAELVSRDSACERFGWVEQTWGSDGKRCTKDDGRKGTAFLMAGITFPNNSENGSVNVLLLDKENDCEVIYIVPEKSGTIEADKPLLLG